MKNSTRATTVRQGREWLMSPSLQYRNCPLGHRLFPRVPFCRNGAL